MVYILDTSPSMNLPYLGSHQTDANASDTKNDTPTRCGASSRLSCAKVALEGMLCDLMLQSKSNESGVIILNTKDTSHHLYKSDTDDDGNNNNINNDVDDNYTVDADNNNDNVDINCTYHESGEEQLKPPLANLTEMTPVRKPTIELLRSIRNIRLCHGNVSSCSSSGVQHNYKENGAAQADRRLGGDFCNGIILAASAMYTRTHGKQYRRKIVLFTDAMHEVGSVEPDAMDEAVNRLREMECPITVVGLNFSRSAYFQTPAGVGSSNDNHDDYYDDCNDTINKDDKEVGRDALIQSENEKLLISLTKWTGGRVLNPSSLQQIIQSTAGRRIPRSTLARTTLIVAPSLPPLPDLSVSARISLHTVKANLPTLKREALQINKEEGIPMLNVMGEVMTTPVVTDTSHWDPDDPDLEVQLHERITAYPYGSDLIPIGPLDMEGLTRRAPPSVTILGYVPKRTIPVSYLMGPTRVVSGDEGSVRAGTVVSALAQALWKLKQYAVCTYLPRQDADPLMGVLAPLIENEDGSDRSPPPPHSLLYMRMPFAEDWQNLKMMPLQDDNNEEEAGEGGQSKVDNDVKICDDLIDSLMLPTDVLRNESIPNPAIRAYHKTVMSRAIDPSNSDIISTRCKKGEVDVEDSMSTPPDILERAKDFLDAFRRKFPLKVTAHNAEHSLLSNGRKKKKFWSDLE